MPRRLPKSPALAAAALLALAGITAHAESFASSAISNSVSASVGSVSTSFNASSDASSPGRPMKAGAWRVMDMAVAAGREGFVRLALRAETNGAAGEKEETVLFLPHETVARAALAVGQIIHARERSYGLELASGHTAEGAARAEAFYLVVADDVFRELRTRPVKL